MQKNIHPRIYTYIYIHFWERRSAAGGMRGTPDVGMPGYSVVDRLGNGGVQVRLQLPHVALARVQRVDHLHCRTGGYVSVARATCGQ